MTLRTLHPLAIPVGLAMLPIVFVSLLARHLPAMDAVPLVIGYAAAAIAILIAVHGTPGAGSVSRTDVTATWAVRTALVGIVIALAGFSLAKLGHGRIAPDVFGGWMNSAGVLLAGVALGALVAKGVQSPGHLPAVALVSSAGDIWSVTSAHGVTHAIVATPDLVLQRLLTVSAAVPPDAVPNGMIGFGDVLFAALYIGVARKFGLSHTRTLIALGVGLLLALAATFLLQMAVPALPALGLCVVAAHPASWTVPRKDRMPTWVAAGVLLAMVVRAVITVRAG